MEKAIVKVLITGRVQGVGFRYSTSKEAHKRNLSGWCRNNSDNSVSAVFAGERERIEEMLRWCKQGPLLAKVDSIKVEWLPFNPIYQSFSIEH